ncbi:MAG: asparaginase [Clostridia bacterium]|nr:asparaginase [Clostridia bacterium]
MSKNILVVYTGGTICTTIKDGVMSTDASATSALTELFYKSDCIYKNTVALEKGRFFNILSENMTIDKWNEIIAYFQEIIPTLSQYDGIIIAHGTDTLAFSCALFSVLLKGISIPVFFVSSNNPILCEDGTKNPLANGAENFRAAIECICKGISPDVYATYRNTDDGRMYLHKAGSLIQCAIYDDNFYSADATDITDIENMVFDSADSIRTDIEALPIMRMRGKELTDCVLKVNPYIGLNYDVFNLEGVRAVLHGTYHSGTSCVMRTSENPSYNKSSILYFFEKCASKNIPFYYSPSQTGAEHTVYASVPFIEAHRYSEQKIRICYGQTDELMYAKLIIAYSVGLNESETDELLK